MSERRIIAREDVMTSDRRRLEPGSLWWTDEPMPLLVAEGSAGVGHDGSELIGTVTDVRREHGGVITAELSDPWVGYAPEIDCDELDVEMGEEGELIILGARLRAVTLGRNPCWDGMMIE